MISKRGVGSTFWVELPLGVGARALREPSWSQVAGGHSPVMGTDWPKIPYPSPATTIQGTPIVSSTEMTQTPSTLGPHRSYSPAPTDYIGDNSPAPHSSNADYQHDTKSRPTSSELVRTTTNGSIIHIPSSVPEGSVAPTSNVDTLAPPDVSIFAPPGLEPKVSGSSRVVRPTFIAMPSNHISTTFGTAGAALARPSVPLDSHKASSSAPCPDKIGDDMHVLVVDDDNLTRRLMSRMLQVRIIILHTKSLCLCTNR